MESKKLFEVYCSGECGEEFDELFITKADLDNWLITANCPKCNAPIKQKVSFGAGRFRGTGFTKRGC